MANASSRFFWNDWQGDPALRACSLAAQGLWMRMLCIGAEASPPGHVLLASGHAPTDEELARIVGTSPAAVRKLTAELDRNGVSSRTPQGVIYNRRMVREADVSSKRTDAGAKGAHATWGARDGPASPVLPSVLPWQNDGKPDGKTNGKQDGKPGGKSESFAMPFATPSEDSDSGSDSGVQNPESLKDSGVTGPRADAREERDPPEVAVEAPRLHDLRKVGGPDFSRADVRKAAWEMKAFSVVKRMLPDTEAVRLIAGYLDGAQWAKMEIERLVYEAEHKRGVQ